LSFECSTFEVLIIKTIKMEYLTENKEKILNLINSSDDNNIQLAIQKCGYEWLYENIFKDTYELISKYGYRVDKWNDDYKSRVDYCLDLELLDLSNNNITSFDVVLPNLEWLDLSNNNITSFDETKYKNVKIYL